MQDKSFGVVPLRKDQMLLVQHAALHWGFPKGHAEPFETPKETAERELFEETHLTIERFCLCDPIEEAYSFERAGVLIEKKVLYFPAWVHGELCLAEGEIVQAAWCDGKEALSLATFPEMQRVVSFVIFLQNRGDFNRS